jgi:hypothetical protein
MPLPFLLIVIVIVILIGHGSCGLRRSFSAGLAPICPLGPPFSTKQY